MKLMNRWAASLSLLAAGMMMPAVTTFAQSAPNSGTLVGTVTCGDSAVTQKQW